MKKLLKILFKNHWKKILLIILLTFLNVGCQLIVIESISYVLDLVKIDAYEYIFYELEYDFFAVILSFISSLFISYLSVSVAANFSYNLKEKLFNLMMDLNTMEEYNQINFSGLMTRFIRACDTEQSFILILFRRILPLIVASIFVIYKLWEFNYLISIIFTIFLAVFTLFFMFKLDMLANDYFKVKALNGTLNHLFRQKIIGLKTIKSFSNEEDENKNFKKHVDNAYNKGFRFQYRMNFSVVFLIIVHIVFIFFILMLLIIFDTDKTTAMEAFISLLYIVYLINRLNSINPFVSIYPLAYTSSIRLEEVLDFEEDIITRSQSPKNNFDLIKLENISLTLDEREILSDISFEIPKKSKTLIVGSVASGKTSLLYSLLGFHELTSGKILIDDEILCLNDSSVKTSFISDKSLLFKDSVFENIRLGDESITREDAKSICGDVLFDKDLSFEVNEEANNLNGDLKQRLALASALAQNNDVYIFDNAFSLINPKSKKIIGENIKKYLKEKTVIFIDNSFDYCSDADNIIVLDAGKLMAQGNHEELIKNCETYKMLFNKSKGGL